MTSFGWKRKIGATVSKASSKAFEEDSKDEDVSALESGEIDWLHLAATKKVFTLEDAESKSKRLQSEGTLLADDERFWEAIKKWDSALQLTPDKAVLHELKAQAYTQLNEHFPAVNAARKAIECDPTWYIGYVTLGRGQMNIGEVKMAIKSFSQAVHLNPTDEEVWKEDLAWAVELWNTHQQAIEKQKKEENEQALTITEIPDESEMAVVKKVNPNFLLPVTENPQGSHKAIIRKPILSKNMVKLKH
jgi:tetratricopeptide (TPR) repeat protein